MQSVLDKQPFARKTRVVTKEDAIKMESQVEGHNVEEFLGFNPLYASVILKLNEGYVNKDSLNKIKQFVMQSNVVRSVSWPDNVVDKMNSNLRQIGIILGCISILLFIVVVFLIDNTVRLAMFSNRFLIKTMQMVGATQRFISRPFDRRAVLNGFISGLVAVVALWMVVKFASSQLEAISTLNDPALLGTLMLCMIVLGICISLVSTHRSVTKYLKMHIDDLY
jgi:cell division transport system permease protein